MNLYFSQKEAEDITGSVTSAVFWFLLNEDPQLICVPTTPAADCFLLFCF